MEYYKRGQGLYARVLVLIGAGLVGLLAAGQVMNHLRTDWVLLKYGLSGAVAVAFIGPALYLCLFHAKVSDYLVETQTELRKVAWSPWPQVVASTIVVIVTVAMMGIILYGLDRCVILALQVSGVYGRPGWWPW